jgi:hypothetical protein
MRRRARRLCLLVAAVGSHVREVAAVYSMKLSYMGGARFFDHWNFITTADPTHGDVEYVSYEEAAAAGLVNSTADRIYIGADAKLKATGAGRRSVRIESKAVYNSGLFIFNLDHMPTGCGAWYAFWMFGDDANHPWPQWGEFDIVEGFHTRGEFDAVEGFHEGFPNVSTSLHTTYGCDQSSVQNVYWKKGMATKQADNCDVGAPDQWANQGCNQMGPPGSIGKSFNRQGGGTFAAEWDPDGRSGAAPGMRVWYWPSGQVPRDILVHEPAPSTWGAPYSQFSLAGEVCPSSHFKNMRLVLDITFCGDLGEPTYKHMCPELAKEHSCRDLVMNHPEAFAEAFWSIRTLDVYTIEGLAAVLPPWVFILSALSCLGGLLFWLRNRLEGGPKGQFDIYGSSFPWGDMDDPGVLLPGMRSHDVPSASLSKTRMPSVRPSQSSQLP